MKPKKLSEEEIKELQKEFPKIEEYKNQRIQNKLNMVVLLFWLGMLVGVMYYLYLTLTYQV